MTIVGLGRLRVVVHEARSPVAALAAVAQAFGAATQHERRTLARLAVAAAQSIERLVVDAAVVSVLLEDVDLRELAEDAAAASGLRGSPVRVVGGQPVSVLADPVRLRQAVDNLLSNAARHAGPAEVVLEVVQGDGLARMSVSDDGCGIRLEDQERLFEPGVRFGARAGSGVGLALARAVAEAHGGTLSVASQPGAGATFTLTLPSPDAG